MNMSEDLRFLERLNEAIRCGSAKQVHIAEYCDVSEQAVARWKKRGQITSPNLFALSEVSGYRYLWIKQGTGEKRVSSPKQNLREYMQEENLKPYLPVRSHDEPPALELLIDSIRKAYSRGALSDDALTQMSGFINSLAPR